MYTQTKKIHIFKEPKGRLLGYMLDKQDMRLVVKAIYRCKTCEMCDDMMVMSLQFLLAIIPAIKKKDGNVSIIVNTWNKKVLSINKWYKKTSRT